MIRFITFPRTLPPDDFIFAICDVFKKNYGKIATEDLNKGLESDEVLKYLNSGLISLGFEMETSKKKKDKIYRPVYFGENGKEIMKYEIDGFHEEWKCGIEIEAGRAIMGNAVYRDLVQSLVMVNLEHLVLAVPNAYKYKSNNKVIVSKDFDKSLALVDSLYGHSRVKLPYRLTLIGY